jgi:DNA-binding MarR family transcriptional regulator
MKYQFHQCLGARFRRISRIIDTEYRTCIQDFGITENQMNILFVLQTSGEISQGQIGDFLVLERSTISRNINVLEKQALVMRTSDYQPKVELTKKGKTLVKELVPVWEKVMDNLIEIIGLENFENLKKLEKKLI